MAQLFPQYANNIAKLSLILGAGAPFALFYLGSTLTRGPANTNVEVALAQPVPFSHKHHAYELGIECRYCHWNVEKGPVAGVPGSEVCMSCHSQIWTNSPLLQPVRDSYNNNTPLVWNKVNKVPEFVYFDHSIHIARGLNCNQCHGRVTKMQLTYKGKYFSMAWCLDCHTKPEEFLGANAQDPKLTPQDQAFELYHKGMRGEKLTPTEYELWVDSAHTATPEEIEKGKELVKKYGVKKEQLRDCYICHR